MSMIGSRVSKSLVIPAFQARSARRGSSDRRRLRHRCQADLSAKLRNRSRPRCDDGRVSENRDVQSFVDRLAGVCDHGADLFLKGAQPAKEEGDPTAPWSADRQILLADL